MLIIRLIRIGKKNAPSFRIVLIKKTAPPKSGKFLELLGSYNPLMSAKGGLTGQKEINLKKERIKYWLDQGVKVSETVHNLLVSQGIIKGPKIKKKIKVKNKKELPESQEEKELSQFPSAKEAIEGKEAKPKSEKEEKKKEVAGVKEEIKEEIKEAEEAAEETKSEKKEAVLDKSEEKSKIEKE